jgi:hypothetical protein
MRLHREVSTMKKATLWTLALTLVLISSPALGDGFGIGPRMGYYRERGAGSGDILFGAAMRAKFLTILGVEGLVDYRQETVAGDALSARSWPIQVTGLIYPLTVLHAGMGAGWYRTTYDFDEPGVESETLEEFGWHLGTGLEIPLGSAATLTGDVRWVYLDTTFEELPESVQRDTDFYVMSVGILFGL